MRVGIRRILVGHLLTISMTTALLGAAPTPASAAVSATIRVSGSLNIRTAPSTSSAIVGKLRHGSVVSIDCMTSGTYVYGSVRNTAQWDRLHNGNYISHAFVNTKTSIQSCSPPSPKPASPVSSPSMSVSQAQFIADSVIPAQQSQREYGIPASVTIAQAILESGWGKSWLTSNDNNFFGMKCFGQGPIATSCHSYMTRECRADGTCYLTRDSFRVYASRVDSFRDHGRLLARSQRYAAAFKYTNDPNQFIVEIHKGGYATDPIYATSVQKLMSAYNLNQYNVQ